MGFDYGTVYSTLCIGFSEIGYRIHGCGTSNADRYMDPKTRQIFLSIRCAACATNDLGYVCPYRPSPKETLVLDSSLRINSFSRSCTITRAYESISPQHTQMLWTHLIVDGTDSAKPSRTNSGVKGLQRQETPLTLLAVHPCQKSFTAGTTFCTKR